MKADSSSTIASPQVAKQALAVLAALVLALALTASVGLGEAFAASGKPEVSVTRASTGKLVMKRGSSYRLDAKASSGKLAYKSSKPKIVSVTKRGALRAKKTGKATITVTAKKGSAKAVKKVKVTVVKASKFKKVRKLKAKVSTKKLRFGQVVKLTNAFTPKKASNKNVTYSSSNKKVVTVSAEGVVTATGVGNAKVTVTSCDNVRAKSTVTFSVEDSRSSDDSDSGSSSSCTDVSGDKLTISTPATKLMVGDLATINAVITSRTIEDGKVVLTSSDNSVLMVQEAGQVFACGSGRASITVTCVEKPELSASIEFEVSDHIYSVDTDGDGISDYMEKTYVGTDPEKPDSLDELPDMTIYAEGVHVIEDGASVILSASVDEKGTRAQSDDTIDVTLAPGHDVGPGEVLAVESYGDFPCGIAVKAESVERNADGSLSISGHYPNMVEVIRFLSFHAGSSASPEGLSTQDSEIHGSFSPFAIPEDMSKLHKENVEEGKDFSIDLDLGGTTVTVKDCVVIYQSVAGCYGEATNIQSTLDGGFNWMLDVVSGARIDWEAEGSITVAFTGSWNQELKLGGPWGLPYVGVGAGCSAAGVCFTPIFHASVEGSLRFTDVYHVSGRIVYLKDVEGENESCFENTPSVTAGDLDSVGFKVSADAGLMLDLSICVVGWRIVSGGADVGLKGEAYAELQTQYGVLCTDVSGGLFLDVYGSLVPDLSIAELRASDSLISMVGAENPFYVGDDESPLHWENGEFMEEGCSFKGGQGVEDPQPHDDDVTSGICGTCPWRISADDCLVVGPGELPSNDDGEEGFWPWFSNCDKIKYVWFDEGVSLSGSANSMFRNCSSLVSVNGLLGWDTSFVTDMSGMFYGCSSLKSVAGLKDWATSNVTDMSGMFYDCNSIKSVDGLSEWDTSSVENMNYMFMRCRSLVSAIGLTDWNTSSVTDMGAMFKTCSSLKSVGNLFMWDGGSEAMSLT